MTDKTKLNRRDAIKVLGAAAGASVLANIPTKWSKPELSGANLPAHAQISTRCAGIFNDPSNPPAWDEDPFQYGSPTNFLGEEWACDYPSPSWCVGYASVLGNAGGDSVWGTNPYTTDSDFGKAAVHAGLVQDGQTAIIMFETVSCNNQYQSSTANGVTTIPWNLDDYSWGMFISLAS